MRGLILLMLISRRDDAHSARRQRIRIADLMSKGEYNRAKPTKPGDGEREALDEWLTRYTDRPAVDRRHGHTPEPPCLKGKNRVELCDDSSAPR